MIESLHGSSSFSERLPAMVKSAKIEVIPSEKILDKIALIPKDSELSVTSSPSKGIETTLNLSEELIKIGYKVIPHLAARSIRNKEHLEFVANFLDSHNIEEAFIVGGDNSEPLGIYSDSVHLLDDLLVLNHSLKEVGVAGYPEGHPKINWRILDESLREKIKITKNHGVGLHVNSQVCFDAEKITWWIHRLHDIHINQRFYIGISTPTDILKLAQISKDIGVGDSISFLQLTGIGSAIKSMKYNPSELISRLVDYEESEKIIGFHLFTFNNLKSTIEWQKSFKTSTE